MKVFGRLNVVAHPHPEGIYRRIFDALAARKRGVRFFGDRFAAISPLSETRDSVFTGRLATWVEVDREANTIDLDSFEERLFSESGVDIPKSIGLNSRIFNFAFNEATHQLIVETQNIDGQTLSIRLAGRAFQKLLHGLELRGVDSIDVFVASKADALDRILRLPKIKKVEIDLSLPNPDDLSDLEAEILKELLEGHIKRDKSEITKVAGAETIVLPPHYRAKANIARDNGAVSATGIDEDGEKVVMSTNEYPDEIIVSDDESDGTSSIRSIASNE